MQGQRIRRRISGLVAKVFLASALAAGPYGLNADGSFGPIAAHAKDGGSSGSSGGSGNSGSGNSGSGGGSGNSGSGSSNSGSGHGGGGENGGAKGSGSGGGKTEFWIRGKDLGVKYANGVSERIQNGFFEMHDSRGRRIIARPATAEDYDRLTAILRNQSNI